MKRSKIIVLFLIILLLGLFFYKPKEAEMKLDFPFTTVLDPSIGLSCEAMAGSVFYGSDSDFGDKGIHVRLFKGTDQIAVE